MINTLKKINFIASNTYNFKNNTSLFTLVQFFSHISNILVVKQENLDDIYYTVSKIFITIFVLINSLIIVFIIYYENIGFYKISVLQVYIRLFLLLYHQFHYFLIQKVIISLIYFC